MVSDIKKDRAEIENISVIHKSTHKLTGSSFGAFFEGTKNGARKIQAAISVIKLQH